MRTRAIVIAMLRAGSAVGLVFATPAFAQTTAESSSQAQQATADPDDIVVTARRREETLQDVPIAITAMSAEALETSGAQDITAISQSTPSVTLENSRATNSTLTAFIRGVGQQDPIAGFEQGVGIYLDDVYLNRPQAAVLDIYESDSKLSRVISCSCDTACEELD